MTFNEKLVKLRKLKGITQDEFASAVGVSRQAVYKWESGQSYPEVPKLMEMKLLFGISIDDLLDDSYEVILPEKKIKRKRAGKTSPDVTEGKTVPVAVSAMEVPVSENYVVNEVSDNTDSGTDGNNAPADKDKQEEKKRGLFSRIFKR